MTPPTPSDAPWLRRNWFIPLAAVMVLGDLSALKWAQWPVAEVLEAALLFDFAVLLPLLYWWCYRAQGRAAVVQAVALSCFAIWVTGKLLPLDGQPIHDSVGWLRYVGLAGLALLEIKVLILVYRTVFTPAQSREDTEKRLAEQGVPAWAARLMAWEAMFWRKLLDLLRRLTRRK